MITGFYILFYIFFTGEVISADGVLDNIKAMFTGVVDYGASILSHFESGVDVPSVATFVDEPVNALVLICAIVVTIGVCFGLVNLCKKIMTLWVIK